MDTRAIRLVFFDVDGVLTDGSLYIGADGELLKSFNAKDGVAVGLLKKNGVKSRYFVGEGQRSFRFSN